MASRNIVHLQKIILRCVGFCFCILKVASLAKVDSQTTQWGLTWIFFCNKNILGMGNLCHVTVQMHCISISFPESSFSLTSGQNIFRTLVKRNEDSENEIECIHETCVVTLSAEELGTMSTKNLREINSVTFPLALLYSEQYLITSRS